MFCKYKRFFQTVVGYFLGNVFTKLVSFILLPLYTKLIDPEIYGIYGVNMTIVQLTVPIVFVCIWNSVFRFAAEENDEAGRYEVISAGLPVLWISSFICAGVLLVVHSFWNLYNPILVSVYAVANGFQYFYGYVARSMKDNKTFIISGCVNSTINLLLNWIGVAYLHHGIEVLYYSYIIGTVAQVVYIEFKYRTITHFHRDYVNKDRLGTFMRFGGPLAVNSVMQWLLTGLTQIMIANLMGIYYNGLYSVAIKFATLISLVVSVFEFAWLELAYDIAKNNNSASSYRRALNMLFGVLMFGSAALMLAIKIVFPHFIAKAYAGVLPIIPFIVVYASANALASFEGTIYMSYKAVNMLTISSLIAGTANYILLRILIPVIGFRGAMTALVIASVIMMLIRMIGLQTRFSIGLDAKTIIYLILLPIAGFIFYSTDKTAHDIVGVLMIMVVFIFAARNLYYTYMVPGSKKN